MPAEQQFPDPGAYPIVFEPGQAFGIVTYGMTGFPITFLFDQEPRPAFFQSIVVKQLDSYFSNIDVYGSSSVAQFPEGVAETIDFYADTNDITTARFFFRIPDRNGTTHLVSKGLVGSIRQSKISTNVSHIFSMNSSTYSFGAYTHLMTNYYAAVGLDLTFLPHLDNDTNLWPPVSLPIKLSTPVLMAPSGVQGVLDVVAKMRVEWYLDPARTIPAGLTPYVRELDTFGLRLFVTTGGLFLNRCSITSSGSGVVDGLYSTSYVEKIGGSPISLYYWGGGNVAGDIFLGAEDSISISEAGLPIQGGVDVPAYILPNPLPAHGSSSSSSSSESSSTQALPSSSSSSTRRFSSSMSSSSSTHILPSSSSSSTEWMTTSSSISSFTFMMTTSSSQSASSVSSKSSSSISSSSGSSSSVTSISSSTSSSSLSSSSSFSSSSPSSPSSSTHIRTSSSSSSIGSESSLTGNPVLEYTFTVAPDTFGTIFDTSGMLNNAFVGASGGGLGPPTWSGSYGIYGGGLLFQADALNTDYAMSESFNGISTAYRGTIGVWMKFLPFGNTENVLFSLSNGFVSSKTELSFGLVRNGSEAKLKAQVMLDGVTQWHIETSIGVVLANTWTYVVLRHNRDPRLFVNGYEVPFTYIVNKDRRKWMSSLFSAVSPADRMILGGAPRNYSPFVTLGFTGYMDEIRVWDVPLSEISILDDYESLDLSTSST